jgi:Protein of unknown function (DUF2796)
MKNMSKLNNIVTSLCALAAILPSLAYADGSALPEYVNGKLLVEVEASAVNARLRLPMSVANPDKPGLPPEEVLKRLKESEKLFAFPEKSACKLANASAFAVDREGKPVKRAGDFGNIQAAYRYECAAKPDSMALKVFQQLPDIRNLSLQLSSDKGEQSAELTPDAAEIKL